MAPWASANTCTSMCRGAVMSRSSSRVSSPNAERAVRRAEARAPGSSSAARTATMPLPPPPAEGLISSGKPTRSASAVICSSVSVGSWMPGTTGTSYAATVSFARILSAIASSEATGGPTNTMPAASSARAKSAFSDRKP